jgi:hypothetical protein
MTRSAGCSDSELCPSAGGSGPARGEPAPADMDGVANLAPRE